MINFKELFTFLKNTSPVFIAMNIVIGIVFLLIGGYFSTRKKEGKSKKAGTICIGLSVLFFLGAITNWLVATKIF